MSIYNTLKTFIRQAQEQELLTTRKYVKTFKGLTLKVSFGKGNFAKVPWMAFLKEPNTVSEGIYPVYLFYREKQTLILAYGVSEQRKPQINWHIQNQNTIKDYIKEKGWSLDYRYECSFIHRVYMVNGLPDEKTINDDLQEIIDLYNTIIFDNNNAYAGQPLINNGGNSSGGQAIVNQAYKDFSASGLRVTDALVVRFVSSLITKPFVILTGLSGSGKTKLAQAFIKWICESEAQYLILPVGSDWTNREPLLGYPNALQSGQYVKPDSGVLDLLLRAENDTKRPYFLILDEMNLSHVERYFADFLSAMESGEPIPLFSAQGANNEIPAKLSLSPNLFIVGTVNIDETTYMFSPKVLDRANTIEFRINNDQMHQFLVAPSGIKLEDLKAKGAGLAADFLGMAQNRELNAGYDEQTRLTLQSFFTELMSVGAEFGYRSANEMQRLIHNLKSLDGALGDEQCLDFAIVQKLLPKLHGSRKKLSPVLEKLGILCLNDSARVQMGGDFRKTLEGIGHVLGESAVRFPVSLEKIRRMYRCAADNGYASFAEA